MRVTEAAVNILFIIVSASFIIDMWFSFKIIANSYKF